MSTPFQRVFLADVLSAAVVSIHGDRYVDLTLRHADAADDPAPFSLRAPAHACATPPAPGQRLRITTLLGQVTAVQPADPC